MFIIIVSKKLKLNPDNIATPIASSLGDLVTLAILSGIGTLYYKTSRNLIIFIIKLLTLNFLIKEAIYWTHILIINGFFLLLPIFIIYCRRNNFVKETLSQGWLPIIAAMFSN